MDYSDIVSPCVNGITMDSPVNFYADAENKQVKEESFAVDFPEESHMIGLGDFAGLLQSEDSIDLQAYLDQANNTPNTNSGNEYLRTATNFPTQQHITQEVTPVAPGVPTLQQSVAELPFANQMHVDDVQQQTVYMPLTTVTQTQLVSEQAEQPSLVHQNENYRMNGFDTDGRGSTASSPGMPTSSGTMEQSQTLSHSTSSGKTASAKRKRPVPDRESDEYRQKRERNNIAVRKSREKTKQKNQELQHRVGDLQSENSRLNKKVEMLTKELTVLKSLFTNVGKPVPVKLEKALE